MPVVGASLLQLLLAVTFLIMPAIAYRYGARAQAAAEAEVARQGFPAGILAKNKVKFTERGIEAALPAAIALLLVALASLNLAGIEAGRIMSWIFQPVILVVGGLVTAAQVFDVRYLTSAFRKSGDQTLRSINVKAFVDAAVRAFPAGFRSLVATRFVLTTAGSVLVIVLLAVPAANAYFH
jgi:hypothetical protein